MFKQRQKKSQGILLTQKIKDLRNKIEKKEMKKGRNKEFIFCNLIKDTKILFFLKD